MMHFPVSMPDRGDLPAKYVWISLLPAFIFVTSEAILVIFANNSVSFLQKFPNDIDFSEPGEAAFRLKMLGMAFLVFLSGIAIIFKFASDVKAFFMGPAIYTLSLACVILLSVGMVFLVLMALRHIPIPRERLDGHLFIQLFERLEQADDEFIWSMDTYTVFIAITHVIIISTVSALVAGSISCLAKLPGLGEEENWKYQSGRLRMYIFISSAFLAIGVLYFKSWADYPTFMRTSEPAALAYGALSGAYTSFTGIEYSLVLAAYALPVSYIQARRADQIVVAKRSDLETLRSSPQARAQVSSIKHDEGLELTFADTVKVVFAIVGPFMTGAITNLASAVS